MAPVQELQLIEDPAAAAVALDPVRARLLGELATPASAAALAARVGLPRQRVNYHLRALEAHGLVEVVEERRWGGLTERVLAASASSYLVSPAALGDTACDPGRCNDRLSARYLVALAARLVREVAGLMRRAAETGKRLPTLAIDTEITFASAVERAAFTEELARVVTGLAARYHQPSAPDGRPHRLVVAAHPIPADAPPTPASPTEERA
jgi:DNA-binding transcriptional ArsR family regulator